MPQGEPTSKTAEFLTDQQYKQYLDLMEEASNQLCNTWLHANASSPTPGVLAELSEKNAEVVHKIGMAFGVFNAMLENLRMENRDQAKQATLFNVDPYAANGPYAAEGGRR